MKSKKQAVYSSFKSFQLKNMAHNCLILVSSNGGGMESGL